MGKITIFVLLITFVFVGVPMFFIGMIVLEFLGGLGHLIIQGGYLFSFLLREKV